MDTNELKQTARLLRRDALVMITRAGSGHPGGPLSMADYSAALWFKYLKLDPAKPEWEDRDRYILSNGHASAMLYSLMARRGFFPVSDLMTFRTTNSKLLGHPSSVVLPGVEISAGSLGQGLSAAFGMALGLKKAGKLSQNVFCNCGDGELQEGSVWEAVMAAAHYKTDNLILSVDFNDAQIDGHVHEVMNIEPLADKFRAFNWKVVESDGHDMEQICGAYDEALNRSGKPAVILFKTVMMKGCPTFEDIPGWHGRPPKPDECTQMLHELGFEETYEEALETYKEKD